MNQLHQDYLTILKFVVQERKKTNTLKDVARDLHTSESTLSNFEKAKRKDFDLLYEYCSMFGHELILKIEKKSLYQLLN